MQTIETLDDPDAADSYSIDPIASEDEVCNCEVSFHNQKINTKKVME